jgi:hypothetical protein
MTDNPLKKGRAEKAAWKSRMSAEDYIRIARENGDKRMEQAWIAAAANGWNEKHYRPDPQKQIDV